MSARELGLPPPKAFFSCSYRIFSSSSWMLIYRLDTSRKPLPTELIYRFDQFDISHTGQLNSYDLQRLLAKDSLMEDPREDAVKMLMSEPPFLISTLYFWFSASYCWAERFEWCSYKTVDQADVVDIFDTDRSGSINFMEFEGLYRYIQVRYSLELIQSPPLCGCPFNAITSNSLLPPVMSTTRLNYPITHILVAAPADTAGLARHFPAIRPRLVRPYRP